MKFKNKLISLLALTTMAVPVTVNAGGTAKLNTYTADVDGGTIKVGITGGVILEDTEDINGIIGYEGNPVDIKIPYTLTLKPLDTVGAMADQNSMRCPAIIKGAFKDCSSLKSIEMSGNDIETGAFENCSSLETVIIGSEEREKKENENEASYLRGTRAHLAEGAFNNCPALKKIVIKNYCNPTIAAFVNCPIETVEMPEKFDKYVRPQRIVDENGKVSVPQDKAYPFPSFKDFTALKNINITYGTYSLSNTFENCTSLEKIEIPETVESLNGSFKNCTNLKEVTISGNETPISSNTFEGCPNVTVTCNAESKAAEACKKYGIHAVDFNGNEITGSTSVSEPAPAAPSTNTDTISVLLNGSVLSFTQPPVIENGTTLVPMRAIFEAMGASVDWDGAAQTVTSVKGDTTVSLTLNKTTASVNGKEISLAVPAKLINGSTMVPLRFVSESLGAEVTWDGGSKTVTIKG